MNVFRSKPAMRWLVPTAAAVAVIGGGAAAGTIVASAEPSLPERSAAQLLVDVQNAKVDGFSGTIVQTADLGLPELPGMTSGQDGASLLNLVAGSNSARVWYSGEDKARLALLSKLGETDVIRNGRDVWLWRSQSKEATHFTLPAEEKARDSAKLPREAVPSTPQEAADQALAAIDPTTVVTTTGAAKVAGRDAYELVLSPRDKASLIGQVRISIDAQTHVPLGVNVYAKDANAPALRVEFQQISFAVPDAQQFAFNPPPGTTVKQSDAQKLEAQHREQAKQAQEAEKQITSGGGPTVIGKGWTTVVAATMPESSGTEAAAIQQAVKTLPKVSGTWGSGRLLTSSLFSVLVTDDGRVLAGAVAPETLYQAATK
ncbi:LolA family protein [Mangrovihabitans endophyticus]|uniref:Outer membrane lipoprotein-sorting protein n=1 Tax=Mangrovihabitans endophyticus TaxID=1751298 RepID=A0A8J3C7T7_9ACTN|nr:outer membrane lipoprotein carrier protein LolA [Mangrovihabitans endophyticus]GGL17048.1 hypothetical protein GCM10012284_59550 [Mangrovihabitans endophyticus]